MLATAGLMGGRAVPNSDSKLGLAKSHGVLAMQLLMTRNDVRRLLRAHLGRCTDDYTRHTVVAGQSGNPYVQNAQVATETHLSAALLVRWPAGSLPAGLTKTCEDLR